MNVIRGTLEPFSETGTEGVVWSLHEDGVVGYDGLNCLADGDYLTIFNPEDPEKVVWEGTIKLEWERNYHKYPNNPKYGQQAIMGLWVHGIQYNVEPDKWGFWFYKEYPAELIKGPIPTRLTPLRNRSKIVSGYHWVPRSEGTGKDFHWTDGDLTLLLQNGRCFKYSGVPDKLFWKLYQCKKWDTFIHDRILNKFNEEELVFPTPQLR
ncbi:MAG TPA: hypothetical protein VIY47_10975 [Ignavibacteriaceae bacterium]